ncbi:P-loop containing nucleoside triphosphate hydrolase protein [Cladochytrium replicatum]|nr:P-loop containing nucleoside triphosphate hydrolase protein [Cladochytrium replicatum]
MRKVYLPPVNVPRWFPPHQRRALQQLGENMAQVDVIVEVRDARLPLSSINPTFHQRLPAGMRKRIVAYNKADLSNTWLNPRLEEQFRKWKEDVPVVFCNSRKDRGTKTVVDHIIQYQQSDPARFPFITALIIGLPNVGKSSLLNSLRRLGGGSGNLRSKKVAEVGQQAGVTRAVQTRVKIWESPQVYFVDTPGIMDPGLRDPLQGMKIALAGGTQDSLLDPLLVADYLLFLLNQKRVPPYTTMFPGCPVSDNITEVATWVAKKEGRLQRRWTESVPDVESGCWSLIRKFRNGELGSMTLDEVGNESLMEWFSQHSQEF